MSLISLNTSTCRGYPNHPSRSPIQKLHTASTRRTWGASKLISTTPSTRTAPERRGRSTATHTAVMDPSSAFTVPAAVFLGAARVTAAYAILFFGVLLWQASAKLRWAAHCQAKKESFDRYNDKRMLPYDRTVGNFMEWSVPFLCLFWLSMILSNGATLKWGWVYVAARALYPVMAVNKGIGTVGAKGPILAATVPGYAALVAFIIPVIKALL